jgi:hypothetical protein
MKRYVSKFLKATGRELRPGTTTADAERLARMALAWWNYQKHTRKQCQIQL